MSIAAFDWMAGTSFFAALVGEVINADVWKTSDVFGQITGAVDVRLTRSSFRVVQEARGPRKSLRQGPGGETVHGRNDGRRERTTWVQKPRFDP